MSLLPSTEKRIDDLIQKFGLTFGRSDKQKFRDALALAFKEQDRDTRHACAEAVNASILSFYENDDCVHQAANCAIHACMNVKAV